MSLQGKHIVLGITGSIAAYKAAYLLRLFIKQGAEVQVVMTPAGKEFITPVTLSSLSGKPVVSEFFTANDGTWHSHVDLGLWADAMVIAPATASTIAKMAHGVADNMLVTTYLSSKAPIFVAPAMDLDMYAHPTTQHNLQLLQSYGNHIIEPGTGELASHLTGKGRMAEPEEIIEVLEQFFATPRPLEGKKVMVTAGPTYEKIDPVRFIGNYSSGKMGFAIAESCARAGAEVTLIAGPVALTTTQRGITRIDVESASEMYDAAVKAFATSDVAIMCAAVADYRPAQYSETKVKRNGDDLTLTLTPNRDIAAALGAMKRKGQYVAGFALETDHEEEHARGKLAKKNLDFVVLNSLRDEGAGFRCDTNRVTIIAADGTICEYPCKAKSAVADDITDFLAHYMEANQ